MSINDRQRYRVAAGGHVRGDITIPGDKSISHRALMLGMVAHGQTRIRGLLRSEDVNATLACCQALGSEVDADAGDVIAVHGLGGRLPATPTQPIDLGNSGTAMRLLTGLLAGTGVTATLCGDESLSARPMRRVTDPLTRMGARLTTTAEGTPPVAIHPTKHLHAIDYTMPMASAQVKSAILLAGLNADGLTRVTQPRITRDHTERMLRSFGVTVTDAGPTVSIQGPQSLQAVDVDVPGDLSSAAFFIVAALIAADSSIVLRNIGLNPTRDGVINILREMGADIHIRNERRYGDEPVGDLSVRTSALKAVHIDADRVAAAVDEIPILALAAACADGETVISGAEELRVKESDRIAGVVNGLHALGADIEERDDGLVVRGGRLIGGEADSRGDHRLAMTFAVAALTCEREVRVLQTANVATSFPNFPELANRVGLGVSAGD